MGAEIGRDRRRGPISAINVTPFVDVVLVLLVIFMVTAPSMMRDAIGIRLPEAESKSVETPKMDTIGVAVNRQGQLMLNGEIVSYEQLKEQVALQVAKSPETKAIISADKEAQHGEVIRAIDAVRAGGLSKFALEVQRPENE